MKRIVLTFPKIGPSGVGIDAVPCPKWRYRKPLGPLAMAASRRRDRHLHGHEPLRFREAKQDRVNANRWRKGWPRWTRHARWTAVQRNYGGWSPISDPIYRLSNREFQTSKMWQLVFSRCRNTIKTRQRGGRKSSFDYQAECHPPWRPMSTQWIRLRLMRKVLEGLRA
jgi:hypothetical protein